MDITNLEKENARMGSSMKLTPESSALVSLTPAGVRGECFTGLDENNPASFFG